jgi:hypothetical protein
LTASGQEVDGSAHQQHDDQDCEPAGSREETRLWKQRGTAMEIRDGPRELQEWPARRTVSRHRMDRREVMVQLASSRVDADEGQPDLLGQPFAAAERSALSRLAEPASMV